MYKARCWVQAEGQPGVATEGQPGVATVETNPRQYTHRQGSVHPEPPQYDGAEGAQLKLLLSSVDTDQDGVLSVSELNNVFHTYLEVSRERTFFRKIAWRVSVASFGVRSPAAAPPQPTR